MYVAALIGRALFVELLDRSERMRQFFDKALLALLKRRVAPFAFALPLAVVALAVPEWNPATGLPTPDKSLVPELITTVGFGTAFVVGWLCHRSMSTLSAMAERTTSALWITVVCFVLTAVSGFTLGKVPAPWLALARFGAGLVVALTIWYWNLFLVGIALKHLSTASSLRRYCADSSYWLYIAHLPLVTALQVVAAKVHWHWSIELTLILGISTGVLLLSYKLFVRSTWLGAILNGARRPAYGLEQSAVEVRS